MAKQSNKEKILTALIESPSITAAADKCGVSRETIHKHLKDPEFMKQYRALRRTVVESAIGEMQQATSDAVGTLKKNLTCGNPVAENAAARILLDGSLRGGRARRYSGKIGGFRRCT